MYTPYVSTVPMKEKSAENSAQAYLSDIFAHIGESIAILSDNRTAFTKHHSK